jgi:hypothetical protein
LKTDLPRDAADPETIHALYKDLTLVEKAFRTMKTAHLRVRPVFVRTAAHTRGHVLVVMLAYRVVRKLSRAWSNLNITVEEGLDHLKALGSVQVGFKDGASALRIPKPGALSLKLLSALNVKLPTALPKSTLRAGTRKKTDQKTKIIVITIYYPKIQLDLNGELPFYYSPIQNSEEPVNPIMGLERPKETTHAGKQPQRHGLASRPATGGAPIPGPSPADRRSHRHPAGGIRKRL